MQTHNRFKALLMMLVCFIAYIAYYGIQSPSYLFSDNYDNDQLVQTKEQGIKIDLQNPKKSLETAKPKAQKKQNTKEKKGATDNQNALVSLLNQTKNNPKDPSAWNKLGKYQKKIGKLNDAINSFEKVKTLGMAKGNETLIASALTNLGLVYKDKANFTKAEENQIAALQLYQSLKDQKGMANNFNNLGRTYHLMGQTDRAIETLLKSLAINLDQKNQEGMAQNFGNLGESYRAKGSLAEAVYAQGKSLELNKKLGNTKNIIANHINLGIIYGQNGNYSKSENAFFEALSENKKLNNKRIEAKIYSNLGLLYQLNKQYKKAETIQLKSIKINKQLGNKRGLAISTYNLALVNLKTNQLQNACSNFKKAKTLFTQINLKKRLTKTNQFLSNLSCDLQN